MSLITQFQVLPGRGINVISTLLHTHLLGRSIEVRHFRFGVETTPLAIGEKEPKVFLILKLSYTIYF